MAARADKGAAAVLLLQYAQHHAVLQPLLVAEFRDRAVLRQRVDPASGAARRRKRSLKEAADLYLSLPVTDRRVWNKIARDGVEPEDIDNQMAIIAGLTKAAALGDPKAATVLFDLLGDADSTENAGDDGFVSALREEALEVWQED